MLGKNRNMDDSTELKDMNDELECIAEEVGNEELESMEELTELEMQPIGDEIECRKRANLKMMIILRK